MNKMNLITVLAALLLLSNFTIAVRSLCSLQGSSLTHGVDVNVQLR